MDAKLKHDRDQVPPYTADATAIGESAKIRRLDPVRDVPGPVEHKGIRAALSWVLLQFARAILPILVLAAGFAGYQYMKATKPAPAKRPPQEQRFTVETITAKLADVRPQLQLYGNTTSGREVELRSLVAGRVVDTGPAMRDGAVVERGGMLIKIDPFDYASAVREAEIQQAEAVARSDELKASLAVEEGTLKFTRDQLAIAAADLERAEALARRGNLPDRTVDDRRLVVSQRRQAVTQLVNNVAVWQARIRQQEAAIERIANALARNRQRLSETQLVAPFAAYVTDVNAQVGRMLGVNDRVATLIDRDWIEVRFTLNDEQYGRLAEASGELMGRKVEVEWAVGGEPARYTATIDRVAARVATNSGGVEVVAKIETPDGAVPLRPGAFVRLKLDDILFEDVLRLPASAVYDQSTVYAVVDGRLAARKVEIVATDGEWLLVRGEAAVGEKIVTTRLSTPGTGVGVLER